MLSLQDKKRYFVFTVLPFGLKSSAYIFTKLLRPLVAYSRRQSIKVVLYLDDGFGFAEIMSYVMNTHRLLKTISCGQVWSRIKIRVFGNLVKQ
jgi:hypothetical protein